MNKLIVSYNFIILALFAGFFVGFSSTLLVLLIMLSRLFFTNKLTASIVMLLIGMPAIGYLFRIFGISFPGSLIALLVALFLGKNEIFNSYYFLLYKNSLLRLIALFFLFTVFYFIGPKHEYATNKLMIIYQTGISSFISFYLIANFKNVDSKLIAQMFLLYAIILTSISFEFLNYPLPSSFFDFGFIRDGRTYVMQKGNGEAFNYQTVGMAAVIGSAFWISSERIMKTQTLFFVFLGFWFALMSGARQAIFGIPILIFSWTFLASGIGKIRKIIFPIVLLIILVVSFQYIDIPILQTSLNENEELQDRIGGREFEKAYEMFISNPLYGKGLGGFYITEFSSQEYPHNIFLELLSETGLVGLIFCVFIILYHMKRNLINLRYSLPNQSLFFVIWTAYFIRSLISEDIGANIIIFTSILAIKNSSSILIYPKNKIL